MKQFKTLYGIMIPNLIEYVREYVSSRENVEILIGSDSQCYGNKKTVYGVVIALYVFCFNSISERIYEPAKETEYLLFSNLYSISKP